MIVEYHGMGLFYVGAMHSCRDWIGILHSEHERNASPLQLEMHVDYHGVDYFMSGRCIPVAIGLEFYILSMNGMHRPYNWKYMLIIMAWIILCWGDAFLSRLDWNFIF